MKYFVNSDCIGCGLCEAMCPEVFEMTDQGVAIASEKEVSTVYEDTAEQALNICPVLAIERMA